MVILYGNMHWRSRFDSLVIGVCLTFAALLLVIAGGTLRVAVAQESGSSALVPRDVDPFKPFFLPLPQAQKKERVRREQSPLTEVELAQLQLVSILHERTGSVAVFERPDKRTYPIRAGEGIGAKDGVVLFILHDCVVVRESDLYVCKCTSATLEEQCPSCIQTLERRGYLDFDSFESDLFKRAVQCDTREPDSWTAKLYGSYEQVLSHISNCDEVVDITIPVVSPYYRTELFCVFTPGVETLCRRYPDLCRKCLDDCTYCLQRLDDLECLGYALEIHKGRLQEKLEEVR